MVSELVWFVCRDGKKVSPELPSESACFTWLLKHQAMSVDWALKFEGYSFEWEKVAGGSDV